MSESGFVKDNKITIQFNPMQAGKQYFIFEGTQNGLKHSD